MVEKNRVIEEEPIKPVTYSTVVVCDCSMLNIRKRPDPNSDIVEVVKAGTVLTVDGRRATEGWCKIIEGNRTKGYCMSKYTKANE